MGEIPNLFHPKKYPDVIAGIYDELAT